MTRFAIFFLVYGGSLEQDTIFNFSQFLYISGTYPKNTDIKSIKLAHKKQTCLSARYKQYKFLEVT
jgi:hypothetical protein